MDESEDLESLFGEPIAKYSDAQAVADGMLIPFLVETRDTRHRITSNAFHTLTQHHPAHSYPEYQDADFYRFFFNELLPLIPEAVRRYERGSILQTTYEFAVVEKRKGDVVWYLPNEMSGVTMMLPEDY